MLPVSSPPLRRSHAGSRSRGLALCGLLILGASPLRAEEAVAQEYKLKAGLLCNFTKFVEWPARRFADPRRPIAIGVLGRNPFGDELTKIVRGQSVNGRAIEVESVATASEARAVDILFVGSAEETKFAALSGSLRGSGVLLVGESPAFVKGGGMIAFTSVAGRVRFEINQVAIEAAGLKLSAQLLKLAIFVHRKS